MSRHHLFHHALATFVFLCIGLHPSADAADTAKLIQDLEASKPDWLFPFDKCPADVMPARETKVNYSKERCAADTAKCLASCRAGHANDCYASALVLQKVNDGPASEALYLKACTLGVTSGCTNRAAALSGESEDNVPCAVRTYEKACDRNDPWACTMLGMHLARGVGVAKDPARAKKALAKSCKYGEEDPACTSAKDILREIGK